MLKSSVHLLINTGSRQSDTALHEIEAALDNEGLKLNKKHILKPGSDMAEVCSQIVQSKPTLVIICGGDGTVSNALHCFANSNVEIGIIPLGTTNNFARSLNLPLSINEAVNTIAIQKARYVDLGKIGNKHFANVVGVGLSALIAKHVTDKAKGRWGRLAYTIVGFQQLIKHRAFVATLRDKDDELTFSFETHQVIIANGRYHAGKQIAQDAEVDNRELIIFALGGRSWLSFAWHTLDFYVGKRKKVVHSSYVIGKNIRLETSRPQVVEVDGETTTTTPLAVNVAAQAVKVRY